MKYSVIIPIYNAAEKIGRALESVQKQSLKDLEIICVNDGSKDNSADVVKNYAKEDSRIKLYEQQNQGAAAARNLALDLAQGEYIAFLDADDTYVDRCALEKIYEVANANHAEMCMAKIYSGTDDLKESIDRINDMVDQRPKFKFEEMQYDFFCPAYVFNRRFINENGVRFPLRRIYEDPLFLMTATMKAAYIYCVDVEYYHYYWEKKTTVMPLEVVEELLMGLLEIMEIALNKNYSILKKEILDRVDSIYSETLWHYADQPVILEKLIQLNSYFSKEQFSIQILQYLVAYGCKDELRFIRRLDKLKKLSVKDQLIVLYAAGGAGMGCMEINQKYNEFKLAAWIDANKCGEEIYGIPIKDIRSLNDIKFDKIIVAMRDDQVYDSIVAMLLDLGIESDKILRWK